MKSKSIAVILAAAAILLTFTVTVECFAEDGTEVFVPHTHGVLWWSTLYEDLDGGSVKTEETGKTTDEKPTIKFRAAEIFGRLF